MKILTLEDQGELCFTISAANRPRLRVEPGETVQVQTQDAFSGQIRKSGDRRDFSKVPYSNPQSGPIYVEGAKPGDAVSVKIDNIEPLTEQGATRIVSFWYPAKYDTSQILKLLGSEGPPEQSVVCPIRDGRVSFGGIDLPYKPMVGTMATADPMETYLAWFPGPHGGNMDLADVTIGSTLLLPVRTAGALLYLGDVHALQGEGELGGAAVEMPSAVTLTVDLIKGRKLNWPRLITNDAIYAIAASETGRTLEDAMRLAFAELQLWLEEEYKMERWLAFELLTLVARLRVGNFWTVAAGIPKEYLGAKNG